MAMEKQLTFRNMTIEDIITWCKENHQVAWLKAEIKKKTNAKVYPKMIVEETVVDENGKKTIKQVSKPDKSKEPTIEERPISFVEIKRDFANTFFPDMIKNKGDKKKPSMYDIIAALEDEPF